MPVAGGHDHSLGLKSGGSIVAWGWNSSGQCNVPAPNTGFLAVAAGSNHSLGLKGDLDPLMFGNINGKNVKLKTADANGVTVTFSLTGGGYGQIRARANFGQIELYGTPSHPKFSRFLPCFSYRTCSQYPCNYHGYICQWLKNDK